MDGFLLKHTHTYLHLIALEKSQTLQSLFKFVLALNSRNISSDEDACLLAVYCYIAQPFSF